MEELLGHEEFDGTGRPIDYDTEPFATMEAALADGRLRAYCLGITLDALTLAGDILTVVIIEPELYDELFGALSTPTARARYRHVQYSRSGGLARL